MFKLTVGLALVTLVACSQCPNNEDCAVGQTCCQDPTGELSCCPFHHGECCEDHIHCCPESMQCNVTDFTCLNATHILPLVERIPTKQSNFPKSFRMIPSLPASEDDITCPDGSFCPAEFSCLLMASSYGCCPVAQGLVCSDGKHCCPKGHECSADSSSCVKQKEKVETVLCGDGKSECPVDTTCCETEDGQWACCPMPKAVCCDDKIHCCPEDSVCDVEGSKCMSSTNQELPMWAKFPARLRAEWEDHKPAGMSAEAKVTTTRQVTTAVNQMTTLPGALPENSNVPCDDTSSCADGSTCCKTKEGGWACCPLPEAVCCDDFIHCCPHGKTCDVAAGACEGSSGSSPWLEKLPVQRQNVSVTRVSSDVPCDDTSSCEDGSTCCKTKEGGWACCPLPEAVCCDDFIHCCPHGKTCDVAAGTCEGSSGSSPWLEKLPVQRQNVSVTRVSSDVPCDDTSSCEDGSTCCKTKEGGWACCPLPEAVCCDDFIHCCPHGKTCDVAAGTCEGSSGSSPWLEKLPVQRQNVSVTQVSSDVPCDDTSSCEDGSTCCKTKEGGWACCPLPEAVCCDDFIHCCPHGKTCDVAAGTCEGSSGSSPWLEKLPVQRQNVSVTRVSSDVPCDDTSSCEDGSTCCKTKEGGWACCPLPEAVCCDDFIHCCPHGKTCDVAAGTCEGSSGSSPWLEKLPVQRQNVSVTRVSSDVPCDDTSSCEDGSTCCKTKEGGWACCPLPEAVCCDDFIHCCPHGKTCDVAAGTCEGSSGSSPWLEKLPVQRQNVSVTQVSSDVPCDDTSSCEDGSTCCKTKEGGWACCPLPEAVCCNDFIHCCPHGKICNVAAGKCEDPSCLGVPWVKQVAVQPVVSQNVINRQNSNVPCDDTSSCADGSTCCKTKEGGWACCPLPEAVCCDDFIHCCPHGKTCDVAAGTCEGSSGSSPWLKKLPVQRQNVSVTRVSSDVPCDDTSSCEDGSTCCKTKEGGWACCPLPEAVCCDDFIHCCPHGKTCDVAAGTCEGSSGSSPWLEKLPVQRQNVSVTRVSSDVPCDDTSSCEDGSTCCKTKEGGWACCPLPEAVCCDDFIHCCPHGKTCDVAAGTCEGSSGSSPWLEKLPTRPRAGQRSTANMNCNSSHVCPESNTCCKNIDGDWGCCPLPEAVCCRDGFHCCPNGTTCDLVTLTCKSNTTSVPMSDIISASDKEEQRQHKEVKEEVGKYDIRVPCDAHTSCPDHTTCCLIAKPNKWGCCPLPNAVCCTDGEHCCPTHYSCDVSHVSCIKGDVVIPWYNKIAAQSSLTPNSDLTTNKCDEHSSCSTDSTCCHLTTGEWGCCPLPQAVCCSDQQHCCPRGYKCDLHRRSCIKTTWLYVERVPLASIGSQKPQPSVSEKDIQCGGGYKCEDGQTCCPTSQTSWGCCPSSKAECCDDMKHCCPAGYKCGVGGTCTPTVGFGWNNWDWDNWRVFFSKKKRAIIL